MSPDLSQEVHRSFFLQKSTHLSFSRDQKFTDLSPEEHMFFFLLMFQSARLSSHCGVLLCWKHASMTFSRVWSLMYNAGFRLRIRVKENLQQCHTMFRLSFGRKLGRCVYLFNVNVIETLMRVYCMSS